MPAAQIDFDVILEGRLNKLRVFVTQAQGKNLFYNVSVENWSGDQNAPQILARVENALIERQNHKWGLILTVANIAARVAVKVLLGQLVNLRKLVTTQ